MNQNFLDHIQSQAIMAERSDDEKFRKGKYFELMQTLCKAWRRDNPEVPLEMVLEEGIKKVGWEYHAYLGCRFTDYSGLVDGSFIYQLWFRNGKEMIELFTLGANRIVELNQMWHQTMLRKPAEEQRM
mgnify:CR=1 FL=1